MTRLENDPARREVRQAVLQTLGKLERDPFDRRLGTRQFSTEDYGQLRATPVRKADWTIYWMIGPGAGEITIALVAEASI